MVWIALPGYLPDKNRGCIFCYMVVLQKKDPEINYRRNKNLAKILSVVTLFSLISWLPFVVVCNLSFIIRNYSVVFSNLAMCSVGKFSYEPNNLLL